MFEPLKNIVSMTIFPDRTDAGIIFALSASIIFSHVFVVDGITKPK